jgi:UDP-glucose 4-epimerase
VKTAIVTGAYGYIGSVLTKQLRELDYYVIGIDNNPDALNCWMKSKPRLKYCNDFLANCFASDPAMNLLAHYPDATVFHLAANSLLGPSAYEPLTYFQNNTANTLTLLQHLRPTNRLVFASTAAVYALTDKMPIKETAKLDPPNNYGLSKLWCEQMIDSYYMLGNIKASSFRFFNVIGGWGDVGQQDGTPHIVNKLCEAAFEDTSFEIYDNRYPTEDGTCVRDYLHVRDVARALVHADKYMENLDSSCYHGKFNLGTKSGLSVEQIVRVFNTIVSNYQHGAKPVSTILGDRRIGDPAILIADPKKFIKETKFKYEHSDDLFEMIRSAWEFYNAK